MDNRIKEAIILAGGLGRRLQAAIGELPKPLAPVNGKPFLHYLFEKLKAAEIERVILSVGYRWEMVKAALGNEYLGIQIHYVVENEALGTGGAIKLALSKVRGERSFVFNGDTLFDVDLRQLSEFHISQNAECTLAAKELSNADRYGTIDISADGKILGFKEKVAATEGCINGGVYCVNKGIIESFPDQPVFSFEKDYLETKAGSNDLRAKVFNNYFMDIGIPEDYLQFQKDQSAIESVPLSELGINKTWTLFLDRDGVINDRLVDDYVKQINELRIIDGVPAAIADFGRIFNRIVVVTNQQGIGKGKMTETDLEIIHGYMNNVFKNAGGEISKFYFAPQRVAEHSNYRKPGTGMGLAAQADYPEIDFSRSLMIGDTESDIKFGTKLGMKTIMLTTVGNISTEADYIFNNLQAVATELKTNNK